jgi:hypothetical protein
MGVRAEGSGGTFGGFRALGEDSWRRNLVFRLIGSAIMLLAILGSVVGGIARFWCDLGARVTSTTWKLSPWVAIASGGLDFVFCRDAVCGVVP